MGAAVAVGATVGVAVGTGVGDGVGVKSIQLVDDFVDVIFCSQLPPSGTRP